MSELHKTPPTTSSLSRSRTKPGIRFFGLAMVAMSIAMIATSQANASGLLVAEGGFGGRLEIKEQDVHVTINNGIAVTEVNQIFLNTENRIVEALYTFPVPANASVSNFSMIINGKEMVGEVVEKQRARKIYESYKQTKKDPGLLEQVDFKTFEMRVFPIQPHAEQHINITYYQSLEVDHDWATYVYPLATSTNGVVEKTTGKFALTLDIKSEIPVTNVTSHSHADEFIVVNHTANYLRASMEVNKGDLSQDVVIAFQTKRARTGLDIITSKHPGEDGYFLLSLTAGKELETSAGGMDYVFIVDVSGSMRDDGKLVLSRNAAQAFIESLGEDDCYEVMAFNNAPVMLFNQLTAANDDSKQKALEFLANQHAKGGTELRPAVSTAYRYKQSDRELNVVILSDGMTGDGEQSELLALIGEAPASSKVFCVGIGNEVNRPLLKQLSEDAGGLSTFISHGDDFDRQAEAFRRKLVHPVATDLTLSIDGVEVYDMLPGELPNLYHGSPIRIIGRYKNAGKSEITVKGTVMGKPFKQVVSIEFPELDETNPQIDRMWAWYQVQSLMGQLRHRGKTPELENQIVTLCEGYSIVSEYASFIVLENDSEYRRWKIERRNATRIQRDRKASKQLEESLQELREKSTANLGPVQSAKPTSQTAQSGSTLPARQQTAPAENASRGRDFDFASQPAPARPSQNRSSNTRQRSDSGKSGGGGGAIDPISGMIAAGMAGAAALRRRRKMQLKNESDSGSDADSSGQSVL